MESSLLDPLSMLFGVVGFGALIYAYQRVPMTKQNFAAWLVPLGIFGIGVYGYMSRITRQYSWDM